MNGKKWFYILLSLFQVIALAGMFATPARADGIIIPDPCPECPPVPLPMSQLVIRYHRVDVTIDEQVAVTHVDQVFYNPNDFTIEGTYLFPLPVDAAVNAFTLWVDGEPVEGKVLEAEQARQEYEQIVASLRDPALLEYAGRGAVTGAHLPDPGARRAARGARIHPGPDRRRGAGALYLPPGHREILGAAPGRGRHPR